MSNFSGFTEKRPGSLSELSIVIFPLIAIALSDNMMIFFDRVILSHYSLNALNSVTLASQAIEILLYAMLAITGMSEVLVAKLYAQKKIKAMGSPSWQMLYFSLASIPAMAIISHYSLPLILHGIYLKTAGEYYQVMIYSVPLIGGITALSAFFVGQGKPKLVLISTVVVCLINLALDFPLIFGVSGLIPKLGPLGAAISAIIASAIQFIWLFLIFLNKDNRLTYHTHQYKIKLIYLRYTIKLGLPIAIGHAGEMFGWLFLIKIISTTTTSNLTIISVGNTLYLLFGFVIDGLSRGLIPIASYYLQLNKKEIIYKLTRSALGLLLIVTGALSIPFVFFPKIIFVLFNLNIHAVQFSQDLKFNLIFNWIYFMLLGLFWIMSAPITAKGHVKLIALTNLGGMWLLAILPIFLIINHAILKATMIWPIIDVYMLTACAMMMIYFWHLSKGNVIHTPKTGQKSGRII